MRKLLAAAALAAAFLFGLTATTSHANGVSKPANGVSYTVAKANGVNY